MKPVRQIEVGDQVILLDFNLRPYKYYKKNRLGALVCLKKDRIGINGNYYSFIFKDVLTGEIYWQSILGVMQCYVTNQAKELVHFKHNKTERSEYKVSKNKLGYIGKKKRWKN